MHAHLRVLARALATCLLLFLPGRLTGQPAAGLGTEADPAVPSPAALLGFTPGDRMASHAEVERCLQAWSALPQARLVEHGRTWEGRPLYHLVLGSPQNLARIEAIQADIRRLADLRSVSPEEEQRLAAGLPGVAWLGYSIHGDETSGVDAALLLIHHLLADRSPATAALLRDLIILVDPNQNPDGRERFRQMLAEHDGRLPNYDHQALQHSGHWPVGRTNHYFADMNRDWIFGLHPETRGRIAARHLWRPLLDVDAHEMGALDTFLFSPPREPRNPHQSPWQHAWTERMGADQAAAFDARGWLYYTGEWNDDWYPGYTDAWVRFRGGIGMLYEQAGVNIHSIRRPEGTLLTYADSVARQAVSSLANLTFFQRHFREIQRASLAARRADLAPGGPFAGRTFAVLPSANPSRQQRFLDLLRLQQIEVHRTTRPLPGIPATDRFGRAHPGLELPAGTLLIPNLQPEARLLATLLEFDPRFSEQVLRDEREELLKRNDTRMYDLTAWNLPMLFDLPAYTLDLGFEAFAPAAPALLWPYRETFVPAPAPALHPLSLPATADLPAAYALLVDGADDNSPAVAAGLLTSGHQVRVTRKPFTLAGRDWPRGSLLVTRADNPAPSGSPAFAKALDLCRQWKVSAALTPTGWGPGDLPDLGGGWFALLAPPRLGLFARGPVSVTDFGSVWNLLDNHLALAHSHLPLDGFTALDLRSYNLLILPETYGFNPTDAQAEALHAWVEQGGTLITLGASTQTLLQSTPFSSEALLPQDKAWDKLVDFQQAIWREWAATRLDLPPAAELWAHTAPAAVQYPWEDAKTQDTTPEEWRRRSAWNELFLPSGALLAARADPEHWLNFGLDPEIIVLAGRRPVLMSRPPVESPVRFGLYQPSARTDQATLGWAPLPPGQDLLLRCSGLLWPEAAHALAGSPWVIRQSLGHGQWIGFAGTPSFRNVTLATQRQLANAIVLGPGLGTSQPLLP